jgi:hypothetical protein
MKRACPFRLSMEQRTVVRFFTFKKLNFEDIHTELLLMYVINTIALFTMYK